MKTVRRRNPAGEVDVSIVLPCLNEAATIGRCVEKAAEAIKKTGLAGEVIVADNGSTDGSEAIAASKGAVLVHESERGYGSAYIAGLRKARGRYLLLSDSDDTYDLSEIPKLLEILTNRKSDVVIGTRLGGKILPGAMPWLHRYIGTPILTASINLLFRARLSDCTSGMLAFTREVLETIKPEEPGMAFNLYIYIASKRAGFRIREVPITYYPRKGSPSKLKTFRHGFALLAFVLKQRLKKAKTLRAST